MVDSAPLLPRNSDLESNSVIKACQKSSNNLLQAILIAFAWVFDGQQSFITIFTDAKPKWKCLEPTDQICKQTSNPCGLQPCSWTWASPANTSILSEWGLQCANTVLSSLPSSAFFAGCLVGGLLLSTLADSVLGRKRLLFLSCLIMSLAGSMTVISPNIWVYSALKFVSGFGRSSVGTAALVLSMEIVDKRWREKIGVLGFAFYMLGFLTLPIMAYISQSFSWRSLYLWTNIPSFCYTITIYNFVPESPRWLAVYGRNQTCFSELHDELNNGADKDYNFFASMKILYTTRSTLWRLISVMIASLGISFVYFGMPFSAGNLGTNLYLSVALNALSELPASLLTLLLTATMKRRISILILTTLSGLFSLACALDAAGVSGKIQLAAEVISYCSACTAFNVLLIYSAEIFPTAIRNTAIGFVREAGLLAGVVAPILAAEGQNNRFWSFGFFGLVIMLCGLSCLCLPETKGKELTDHIEEEANN
ncbi:Organic cation transporter-related family protein [Rhynchospora pubera]|uniref:H(+)/Pi cotransporter n=1 Tax=Rhynchospora pubera TaxID=906938 RepID=A0AAV8GJK1_9POAL|nr:Organic cation transporter-related family protein [Rhynchospora pubera]